MYILSAFKNALILKNLIFQRVHYEVEEKVSFTYGQKATKGLNYERRIVRRGAEGCLFPIKKVLKILL